MKKNVNMKALHLVLISFALPGAVAQAPPYEPSERLKSIRRNMRELEVSFTLDRTEYLSGEDPKATIRIKNPTQRAMEVYVPLDNPETSTIKIQSRSKYNVEEHGTEWWPIGHEHASRIYGAGEYIAPTTTIEAGAEFEVEVYLDGRLGRKAPVFFSNFVMLPEGDYRACYSIGGDWVEFHVVQPRQVSSRRFDRRPIESLKARGLETPPFLLALLGTDVEEVLVIPVGAPTAASAKPERDHDGRLSLSWIQTFAPFIRVASSKSGFASYGVLEEGDNVVVNWEARDGSRGVMRLQQSSSMLRPAKN